VLEPFVENLEESAGAKVGYRGEANIQFQVRYERVENVVVGTNNEDLVGHGFGSRCRADRGL